MNVLVAKKIVVALAGLFAATSLASWTWSRLLGPRLHVDADYVDLGALSPGERREVEFTLHNRGVRELVIERAQSSCECSRPTLSSKIIRPGAAATLKVDFLTPHLRYRPAAEIRLYTNASPTPRLLHIGGVISPALEIYPPHIVMGETPWSHRTEVERVFDVRSRYPDDCEVEVLDTVEPPGVVAELSAPGQESRRLSVRLTEHCPIGPIAAKVRCLTRGAKDRNQVVTLIEEVRGRVSGPVRAEPPTLLLDHQQWKARRDIKVRIVPTGALTVRHLEIVAVSANLAQSIHCSPAVEATDGILIRGKSSGQFGELASDQFGAVLVAVQTDTEEYPLRIGVRLLAP